MAAAAARAEATMVQGPGAEPVPPPQRTQPLNRLWNKFLQKRVPWRNLVYKAYQQSKDAFTHMLIPAWIIHHYLKYHVNTKPYTMVQRKPRILPGDTILETGE